jgi:hypothetical protein
MSYITGGFVFGMIVCFWFFLHHFLPKKIEVPGVLSSSRIRFTLYFITSSVLIAMILINPTFALTTIHTLLEMVNKGNYFKLLENLCGITFLCMTITALSLPIFALSFFGYCWLRGIDIDDVKEYK